MGTTYSIKEPGIQVLGVCLLAGEGAHFSASLCLNGFPDSSNRNKVFLYSSCLCIASIKMRCNMDNCKLCKFVSYKL